VREGERWSRVNNLTDINDVTFKKPKSKTNAADYVIEALCKQSIDANDLESAYEVQTNFDWIL